MERLKDKKRISRPAEIENLLEDHYGSLRKWAVQLTHGDVGTAQEIVHDLCLHFVVSRPDVSNVSNIDGYLYTCLRHIYLSNIARAAREAMRLVNVTEFDSIQAALSVTSGDDLVGRQNDLRRICCYMIWRKETSKSASYFILHFFHNYTRSEIAEVARLPISAIYNKLKTARTEIKAHLENSGKLRVITRDVPPVPEPRVSTVSSSELFSELRASIFAARNAECLPVEELLSLYQVSPARPIPCLLLSHIVSCERCLSLIDSHFQRPTLEQRDGMGDAPFVTETTADDRSSFHAMMRIVRRERERIYEHRPRMVSIAVNGRINSTHNIQGEWSSLSARLDEPEAVRFVEVFTDQQIRLALLPVGERPPDGPHVKTQRVSLSDDRWLELTLCFDGLGLETEVIYFDPALTSVAAIVDDLDDDLPLLAEIPVNIVPLANGWWKCVRDFVVRRLPKVAWTFSSMPAVVWTVSILLLVAGVGGYFAYRSARPLNAKALLDQSAGMESANLAGVTEHQIFHVEVGEIGGRSNPSATIDVWRDGNGHRYTRRVYDSQQHLIATEWRTSGGELHSWYSQETSDLPESNRLLIQSDLWKRSISSGEFRSIDGQELRVQKTDDGYELTMTGSAKDQPQLVSSVLVLDRRLHPVREQMRVRNGVGIKEVRFIEANYERHSSSVVPDSTFIPEGRVKASSPKGYSDAGKQINDMPWFRTQDVRLSQLQIAVLYQLSQIGADVGEPIEVSRTADAHIKIIGTVADEARRKLITSRLDALVDHQLLDVHLIAQSSVRTQVARSFHELPDATNVYSVGSTRIPVDEIVRKYLESKGTGPNQMDAAVAQFSNHILTTSQRALQTAYALERLGAILAQERSGPINPQTRQQWTEMVVRHSAELQNALSVLKEQLSSISPEAGQKSSPSKPQLPIDDPAAFARAAHSLLRQVQEINHNIGVAFAYSPSGESNGNIERLLESTVQAIPSREAKALGETAQHLSASEQSLAAHRQDQ